MKNINGSKKIPVAKTIQVQDGINCKKHKKWSYRYVKLLSTEKSLAPIKKSSFMKMKSLYPKEPNSYLLNLYRTVN